ncbi:MAG: nuclear transport factor 2 family protein [Acidobacteriota bacterium]|nr:nuclear transport factor 2 family protein [Acidobacteriota bacterium]
MSQQLAENFINALHKLEETSDPQEIASLYAENAEIVNVVSPKNFTGAEGAREFWTRYRETFGEMRSEFRNKIVAENRAALEWTTQGTSKDNHEITYSGVTILEFDGDKISRSCAYFNSHDLGRQIEQDVPAKPNQAVSA